MKEQNDTRSLESIVAGRIRALKNDHQARSRELEFLEYAIGHRLLTHSQLNQYLATKKGIPVVSALVKLNGILAGDEVNEPRLKAAIAVDDNGEAYVVVTVTKH